MTHVVVENIMKNIFGKIFCDESVDANKVGDIINAHATIPHFSNEKEKYKLLLELLLKTLRILCLIGGLFLLNET